jgi:putative membrane protein
MHIARRTMITLGLSLGGVIGVALALPAAASAAPAAPAASVSAADRTWMVAAHQSNLAEIAAGKVAQQKASSQKVREIGQMLITDHSANDAKLTAAAKKLGVSLPGAPNPTQRAALARVSAKSGAAFDSAWIASQITGHRQTLAATDTELSSGSNATVLALAKATRPIVAKHLNELLAASGRAPSGVSAGTGGQAAMTATAPGLVLTGLGLILAAAAAGLVARRRTS